MSTVRLSVNGVTYSAEVRGNPAAGPGPLVLLHGFTGSGAGWGAHLDALAAAAGPAVVAPDMLGHGSSDAPADPARYGIAWASEDIVALLAALGVAPGRAILLGYSMGGRIALHAALSGFFRALVLESASPGLATEGERAARRASDAALAERIEREGVPAFMDEWQALPLWNSQRALPEEVRARLRARRLANRAEGLANSLRGVGTGSQPDLRPELPRLTLPTLLLAGELDAKYVALAREMAGLLPNAELQVIPGAGHAAHVERPDVFDRLVGAFCVRVLQSR